MVLADAVEKGGGAPPIRNNRIDGADFLNRSCAFATCFESMLPDLKWKSGADARPEWNDFRRSLLPRHHRCDFTGHLPFRGR
jgi:hypothetical protein